MTEPTRNRYIISLQDASLLAVISFISGFLGSYFSIPASGGKTIIVISVIAALGGISLAAAIGPLVITIVTRVLIILLSVSVSIASVLAYVRISEIESNDWSQFVYMSISTAVTFFCFGIIIRTTGLKLGKGNGGNDISGNGGNDISTGAGE
jgi:hypothetical protein